MTDHSDQYNFTGPESRIRSLVLPLLIRGDLLPAESRTADLLPDVLEDLIPEDDLLWEDPREEP
jgi:hypothetical protein